MLMACSQGLIPSGSTSLTLSNGTYTWTIAGEVFFAASKYYTVLIYEEDGGYAVCRAILW